MGFRIYRTGDGMGMIRYEKISTSPIGGGGKSLRAATRIVAASNSLNKSSADYVCDGVHDEEEINKAISDIATTGGTVLLLEGTYNVGSAGTKILEYGEEQAEVAYGIYISSNVSLVGQGKSTVLILDSNNFSIGNALWGTVILSDNASGIEISDLVIDGSWYSEALVHSIFLLNTSNSSVYNCTIQRFSFSGIAKVGGSYNCIANNTISNCTYFGIYIWQSSNCIISNNVCNTNTGGIAIGDNSNGNIVSNNECCNSTQGAGIELYMSSGNYVSGNVCISNEWGIYVETTSSNNVVCNNIVYTNRQDGIIVTGSDDNLISGNLVVGNSQSGSGLYDGIHILGGSNNTISDNVVRHTSMQRYGIWVSGTRNLIINNDLYQAGTSADFYDGGTDTVYHNNRTTEGWIP
jgi:parallel beta-helix repeat protein